MIKCDKGLSTITYDSIPEMVTELDMLINCIYKEISNHDCEEVALYMMVSTASDFCKANRISPYQIWRAIETLQNYEEGKYAAN